MSYSFLHYMHLQCYSSSFMAKLKKRKQKLVTELEPKSFAPFVGHLLLWVLSHLYTVLTVWTQITGAYVWSWNNEKIQSDITERAAESTRGADTWNKAGRLGWKWAGAERSSQWARCWNKVVHSIYKKDILCTGGQKKSDEHTQTWGLLSSDSVCLFPGYKWPF